MASNCRDTQLSLSAAAAAVNVNSSKLVIKKGCVHGAWGPELCLNGKTGLLQAVVRWHSDCDQPGLMTLRGF